MKILPTSLTSIGATKYGEFIIKWRWLVLISILAMVLSIGAGSNKLTISNDSRIYFSTDNPQLLAFEEIEKTYSEANTVLIGLAPNNGDIFQNDTLKAIETLTENGWQLPYATRVNSLTNHSHTRAEADELIVEGSADAGLSILSGTDANGSIMFGDSADNDGGRIQYGHLMEQHIIREIVHLVS